MFHIPEICQTLVSLWISLLRYIGSCADTFPDIVFTTAHTAIQIAPSNYFKYDQSRDTVNMVRLDYEGRKDKTKVLTFGAAHQICMANLSDLNGYGYY